MTCCRLCGGSQTSKNHRYLCVKCYQNRTNSRLLATLASDFVPSSEYNRIIFDLYLTSLKQVAYLTRLIHVSWQFRAYLEQNPLPELTDWLNIFDLSDQLNIRYAQTGQFCPILRVARILEQQKRLPRRDGYKELSSTLKKFGTHEPLLREYYSSLPAGNIDTSQRRLRTLLSFHEKYGLLPCNQEDAASYFELLSRKSLPPATKNSALTRLSAFFEWLILKRVVEKNPFAGLRFSAAKIICQGCRQLRSLSRSSLCLQCYSNGLADKKLLFIEATFVGATAYNDYLFRIYIKSLRRHRLRHHHVNYATKMAEFLTATSVSPIKTWADIRELNSLIPNEGGPHFRGNGFVKIGRMLEELGVLEHRELDLSYSINGAVKKLDPHIKPKVEQFIKCLRKSKMAETTIRSFLGSLDLLYSWTLAKYGSSDVLDISRPLIEDFILNADPSTQQLQSLNRYFSWAVMNRFILQNPIYNFKPRKPSDHIKILPPEKIKKLIAYVKNPNSDPEFAFLLALAIFWGFTRGDFAFSTIDDTGETIVIHVYQPVQTAHRKTRKPPILSLIHI